MRHETHYHLPDALDTAAKSTRTSLPTAIAMTSDEPCSLASRWPMYYCSCYSCTTELVLAY